MDRDTVLRLSTRYLGLSIVAAVLGLLLVLSGLSLGLAGALGAYAGGRVGFVGALQRAPAAWGVALVGVFVYFAVRTAAFYTTVDTVLERETGRRIDEVEGQLASEIQRLRHDVNEFEVEGFKQGLDRRIDDRLDDRLGERIDSLRRDLAREVQNVKEELQEIDQHDRRIEERLDALERRVDDDLRHIEEDLDGIDSLEAEIAACVADLEATVERLDDRQHRPRFPYQYAFQDY